MTIHGGPRSKNRPDNRHMIGLAVDFKVEEVAA
jgi:hypothetical protein